MDSVKRSAVTPSKTRLGRAFSRVLNIKSLSKASPEGETEKKKSNSKNKKNQGNIPQIPSFDDEDEELKERVLEEAFLAKVFANISSVKAAYAQLQFAQTPYDTDGIQSADEIIVSELQKLSELKQSYLKHQLNEISPETTLISSEIQEQSSLLKIYEISIKKFDSQLKLKDSEVTFLQEKLTEMNKECKSMEKRLYSSGQIGVPENTSLSSLMPSHFMTYHRITIKSVRSFVMSLVSEMESASWDLDNAASAIEPGISFWKNTHKCFAFESYICKIMFDGFDSPSFSTITESLSHEIIHQDFFDMFMELKSTRATDYLSSNPKSSFTKFCRGKYLKLIHPKMETSLFGNSYARECVKSGEFPDTPFFSSFAELAKRVWRLHCLAFSFNPVVTIFQVNRGASFSEVYMESLSDEAFSSGGHAEDSGPCVAFNVVPGFKVGKTIVQCQVYLK